MLQRDSSGYTVQGLPNVLDRVLTIGWLKGPTFSTGDAPPAFVQKLLSCILRESVAKVRGIDACGVCSTHPVHAPVPNMFLGTAEVWVPAADGSVIFAAPDLIYHYVVAHRYLPPAEFVDAVMSFAQLFAGQAD